MKQRLICGVMFLLSLTAFSCSVSAEENPEQFMGGYSVEGIPNEHQIDKNVSYFFLHEQPGEKDQIKIKVINNSDKEKTFTIKITDANTNINGLVDYTGKLKNYKTLKKPLTSMVHPVEEEMKVPPKSEKVAELDVQMPSEELEGGTLGGVVVSEKSSEKEKDQNVAVENTYSYTIGILLANDPNVKINQNKSVELEKVAAVFSDGKKVVQADILNPHPYIFGEATVEGKILDETGKKVIQEEKKEQVKIAPQSFFPFQFDWKKEELKPGSYIFEGKVITKEDEWTFKKKFSITETDAKEINNKSVFKIQIPAWLSYGSLIIACLTLISMVLVIKRRKEYDH